MGPANNAATSKATRGHATESVIRLMNDRLPRSLSGSGSVEAGNVVSGCVDCPSTAPSSGEGELTDACSLVEDSAEPELVVGKV
jgi:hypothetical protein